MTMRKKNDKTMRISDFYFTITSVLKRHKLFLHANITEFVLKKCCIDDTNHSQICYLDKQNNNVEQYQESEQNNAPLRKHSTAGP